MEERQKATYERALIPAAFAAFLGYALSNAYGWNSLLTIAIFVLASYFLANSGKW